MSSDQIKIPFFFQKWGRIEAALSVVFSLGIFLTSWNGTSFIRYRGTVKDTTEQVKISHAENKELAEISRQTHRVTEAKLLIKALMSHVTGLYQLSRVAQKKQN